MQGADKPRAFWQRRLLRGDASGRTPCEPGPAGESCLGCTRKLHVLCECAFRTRYAAGPLVKRAFVGENARACVLPLVTSPMYVLCVCEQTRDTRWRGIRRRCMSIFFHVCVCVCVCVSVR